MVDENGEQSQANRDLGGNEESSLSVSRRAVLVPISASADSSLSVTFSGYLLSFFLA